VQRDGIALADVQEMYGEAAAIRKACKGVDQRGQGQHRADEGDAGRDEPRAARCTPQPPRDDQHAKPERGRRPTRGHHGVAARERSGGRRDDIEQRETQPRSRGKQARRGKQRDDHPRDRDRAERDRHQIGDHADRRHGAEDVRADGRREQRRRNGWGEQADDTTAARRRARRPDHGRDGAHRQPGADREHRPRIEDQDDQDRYGDEAARRNHALPQPRGAVQG